MPADAGMGGDSRSPAVVARVAAAYEEVFRVAGLAKLTAELYLSHMHKASAKALGVKQITAPIVVVEEGVEAKLTYEYRVVPYDKQATYASCTPRVRQLIQTSKLVLKASRQPGASFGSEEQSEARNAKRERDHEEAEERHAAKNVAAGLAPSHANLDGSNGGKGYHDHGKVSQETKDAQVVKDMRLMMEAAPTADPQATFKCMVKVFGHLIKHLVRIGQMPEDCAELHKLAKTSPHKKAVRDLMLLFELSRDARLVIAHDLEGQVRNDRDALDAVHQYAAIGTSMAPGAAETVLANEDAGRDDGGRKRRRLDSAQRGRAADGLARGVGLGAAAMLRHGGSDQKAATALAALRGVDPPQDVNVCAALGVGVGLTAQQKEIGDRPRDDAIRMNMDTLAYMVGLDFFHTALDDVKKQLAVWRPFVVALRMHYGM